MSLPRESWEPIGTTLVPSMHLLAVIDDPEGFRVLLQDRQQPWYVYGVYGSVIYYQRNKALPDNSYPGSQPPPSVTSTVLFQVEHSRLLAYLRQQADIELLASGELMHFAICLPDEDRIDIVSKGGLLVRLATVLPVS